MAKKASARRLQHALAALEEKLRLVSIDEALPKPKE
jgi:hypothetical protein